MRDSPATDARFFPDLVVLSARASALLLAIASCSAASTPPDGAGGSGSTMASGPGVSGSGAVGGGGAGSAVAGTGGAGGPIDVGPSAFAVADVDHHRNRLLDTYSQRRGAAARCSFWSTLTTVEKGIFLTHTDMLGHRSCMENSSVPVSYMNDGVCTPSACNCAESRACSCAVGSEQALDHVFKIWAINGTDPACCSGTNCCNGGGQWHRTFFSADDELILYFREFDLGLPEWRESGDFAGPHDPFTGSDETAKGSPRGQTHFFRLDAEASTLSRNGVEGVFDPHIVELDNDYNWIHDSNPEGMYSSTYGRAEYKTNWNGTGDANTNRGDGLPTTFKGNGAPSDISELANDDVWLPTCTSAAIDPGGVVPASGGGPADLRPGTSVVISGAGFLASGNRVHVRTRSMAVALDASSPLLLSESVSKIMFQLPKDVGTGEGYVYVEVAGVITDLRAVTLSP
jgi:hypothetical protein